MSGIGLMLLGSYMPIEFTYVNFSAGLTSTINVPTGSTTGDLLVLFDRPVSATVSIPAQFTVINDYDSGNVNVYSFGIGYRIQQAGDTSFTSASSRKILLAFRPTRTIASVSVNGFVSDTSGASPKTLSVTALTAQTLQFTTVTHSDGGTSDTPSAGSIEPSTGNSPFLRAWYTIGQSMSLTSTDTTPILMKMFAFGLQAN